VRETYTVRYQLTPAVMTDAFRLHQRTFLARYRVVMVCVLGVGIVLAAGGDRSTGTTFILFALAMLAMTWMPFLDRLLFRYRGRGFVGGAVEYAVDDAGIHYRTPLATGTIAWSALTQVFSNDRMVVFGRERALAAYVPTAAFASTAERESFLAFVRGHVRPRSDQIAASMM
jgi:hypothetical protein